MELLTFILYSAAVFLILIILFASVIAFTSEALPSWSDASSEKVFSDGEGKQPFPSLADKASVSLSVVVPAYNEQDRLPVMLDECLAYLEQRVRDTDSGPLSCPQSCFSYEVLVVDDGSRDKTSQVAQGYTQKFGPDKVRCLTLTQNRGKGGAVRRGMLRTRGSVVLFADADGATKFEDYSKLETAMAQICKDESDVSSSLGIVCGSRAHLEEASKAERSMFRTVLMHGFHALVWLFTVRGVRDTQCGFKLLTRRAARIAFNSLHLEGWAFDVEMLVIAERLGIPISEVAVRWTEIDGSKVTPILSWLQMGRDIMLIWLRYLLGAWQVNTKYR